MSSKIYDDSISNGHGLVLGLRLAKTTISLFKKALFIFDIIQIAVYRNWAFFQNGQGPQLNEEILIRVHSINSTLTNCGPFFSDISAIPRISKHEQKIADYVVAFAKQRGLEYLKDDVGNVVIRKKASPGYENRQGVILQAHLDMVPQKTDDSTHDFLKDPIKPRIDGDWVRANKTTLGADNGIGMAGALSILDSSDIAHGPLEVLFTTDEETGMTGAKNLRPNFLQGSLLINLDNEEDGTICMGCAGGQDTTIELNYQTRKHRPNSQAFELSISGLHGGHSGMEIHLPRANAIKMIANLLRQLDQKIGIELALSVGGTVRNAIPRNARALFWVNTDQASQAQDLIQSEKNRLTLLWQKHESGMSITLTPTTEQPEVVMVPATQKLLLDCLYKTPHGVVRMNPEIPDTVQTSNNLATLTVEKGGIFVGTLQRSSVATDLTQISKDVADSFVPLGGQIEHFGAYPGWQLTTDSQLLTLASNCAPSVYPKPAHVFVVHGGLECGLFKTVFPQLDQIAIGPEILGAHSPDERVNIASVGRFWNFLIEILKNIPTNK